MKEKRRRDAARERKASPLKVKARKSTYNAIQRGVLPQVSTCICIDCSAQAQEYHHEDYRKPLDVIPLCRKCHIQRHKTLDS